VLNGCLKSAFSISVVSCWIAVTPSLAQTNQQIYTDSLQNSWNNWSWGSTISFANTSPVHSGSSSISITITNGYAALYLEHVDFDSNPYTNLTFWVHGGSSGEQALAVRATLGGTVTTNLCKFSPTAGTWQQITVTLSSLGVANQPNLDGIWIQSQSASALSTFYVDDMTLLTNGAPPAPPATNSVTITVDAQLNRHPISPQIYGVAFASSNQLSDLNFTMNRSGGNSETRYNWQINAHNLAADWYFESYPDSSSTPGATADSFVADSKSGGAQPMITVPMIGWSPMLGANRSILYSYAVNKYGPQTSVDPWLTNAGNGISITNNTPITWNNPDDANFPTNTAFQQAYMRHLMGNWGASTNGGVGYYLMDNEHSIWFSTHQDVHPVGPTMQEIWTKMLATASMVKSNDPNVLVLGPEEWGWNGYFYSGYDQQWSGAHNDYNPADYPDRGTNGGWDYMPWLLNQFHQHDTNTGQRLLDYFTLHCYPQEGDVSGTAADSATALLRNQCTRVFWDTNYVDPSWINSVIMLIPRMKNWVSTYYPGTKIGVTEYNWGAETNINGATAQADILGIFGWQGLDLATRWTTPDASTPTYNAMKIYRNYDGNKSTFGDTSVSAVVSTNVDLVSSFAAVRSSDGALTVMVINKQLTASAAASLTISNFLPSGTANAITRLSDLSFAGSGFSNTVPAQSITLFVLPAAMVGPASSPNPANGAASVPVNTSLSWKAGTNATLHRVYVGTSSNAVANATTNSPECKGCLAVTNCTPATLAYCTSYYWRVDELAGACTTTGAVWTFTTPMLAGPACNPNPSNGCCEVPVSASLSWWPGTNATSHQVYLGASSNAVAIANTNSPEFKGTLAGTSFAPGVLAASGRFYWRVDEIAGAYVTAGPVWTFATVVSGTGTFPLGGGLGSGDTFVITFPSQLGQTYELERSASLSPASWSPVTNNVPGTGAVIQIPDAGMSLRAQRYYRAVILSP